MLIVLSLESFMILRYMRYCNTTVSRLQSHVIPYIYKFLRDVNFAVFADNLSSTKFKSSKFYKTVVIHLKHKV